MVNWVDEKGVTGFSVAKAAHSLPSHSSLAAPKGAAVFKCSLPLEKRVTGPLDSFSSLSMCGKMSHL